MEFNIKVINIYLVFIINALLSKCEENVTKEEEIIKTEYGHVERLAQESKQIVDFMWNIDDFWELVNTEQELIFSTRFYLTEPGYKIQLMLIPNTTYSDNQGYLGTFFRIVTGDYDSDIEWPYKLKTVLTIVTHNNSDNNTDNSREKSVNRTDYLNSSDGQPFTVIPNTDPCRLRSAFLRPSADQDFNPNPDGCGNRRHIPLYLLAQNPNKYLNSNQNNTLSIKLTVHLADYGTGHRTAAMSMKYNQMVSYYEWNLNNYMSAQNQSVVDEKIVVLTSEPFYTHRNGYLMQMFMTLLPKRKAFAISIAMAQGDFDRYLQWPFPYKFEVAILDQSPGYWKRDYTVSMHPSTSECGTDPFFQPQTYPDFCFITVQSMELLTLTHYNFLLNDTLKISFMTKFGSYSMRKQSSLAVIDKKLVSEYNWVIPSISGKLEKYDLVRDKPKILASEEFYTNGQGYLCQILLTVNRSEQTNDYTLGLELALIEGEYDSVLQWPFNKTFELIIVRNNNNNNNGYMSGHDLIQIVVPVKSQCSKHSFQKPIERNPPCGQKTLISYSRIKRSQDFLRMGNLLVRARIHLNDV